MEVVIKVSDEKYKAIKKCFENGYALSVTDMAILNGTILPKGHGRLIDADAATESFQTFYSSFTAHYEGDLKKFKVSCIAPTVVEADKEEAEHNNDDSIAILKAMQESADAVRNSPHYDFSCVTELFGKKVDE